MRCILKNAKVFSQGVFHLADVFLSDGKIVSIGNGVSRSDDTITIDISNMVLFPGFVDVHVHLREPGFSYKETIRTGTLAAAHGGFAHVAAMPNLNPVPDCVDALNLQRALIESMFTPTGRSRSAKRASSSQTLRAWRQMSSPFPTTDAACSPRA